MRLKKLYLAIFLILCYSTVRAQSFTEIANSLNIDLNGNKSGGHAWGDLNNDGCLDLVVNTDGRGANQGTHMFFSNCDANPDNISFSNVTLTHAAGLYGDYGDNMERSVVLGDFNNDGYVDIARNGADNVHVFINKGAFASPAFSFGDATQGPSFIVDATLSPGLNSEGMAWIDVNSDGWLDLVFDNHGQGTEVLFKQTGLDQCLSTFTFQDGASIGLLSSTGQGDYMVSGDLNDDGYTDILVRKQGTTNDLLINRGDGTYSLNIGINESAQNGNKGPVNFCDFDNDGDLDIFWGDGPRNIIYENNGGNPLTFTQHIEGAVLGINPSEVVDGCACGDVDLDGDVDVFLSTNGGTHYLYRNRLDEGRPFEFFQDNGGINVNRNGESVVLVDYDHDGDLDVSLNIRGNNNQLWRSDLITSATPASQLNFLKVKILLQNPLTLSTGLLGRDVIGARAILRRNGNILGLREVNGGRGHGSQDPAELHFGIPDGPDVMYDLEISFPVINGFRYQTSLQVRPSDYTDQLVVIAQPSQFFGVNGCNTSVALPVRLLSFHGRNREDGIELVWSTTSETSETRFILEKSRDGREFVPIAEVKGQAQGHDRYSYTHLDAFAQGGVNYYRLLMLDENEFAQYSSPIAISRDNPEFRLGIYPNPARDAFTVQTNIPEKESFQLQAFDEFGSEVWKESNLFTQESIVIPKDLGPGMYSLRLVWENRIEYVKLVVQ